MFFYKSQKLELRQDEKPKIWDNPRDNSHELQNSYGTYQIHILTILKFIKIKINTYSII